MSHPATAEQTTSQSSRLRTEADEPRTSQEITAALNAIPSGSVTARTSGALRVRGPRRTIKEERAAFAQAVAEENARSTEG